MKPTRLLAVSHCPRKGPTRRRCACRRLHRDPTRLSTRVRQRDHDGDQGSESEFAHVIEKWRRAGDSNPDTGYPVVDFKSTALPVEASPPCPEEQLLTIQHPNGKRGRAACLTSERP